MFHADHDGQPAGKIYEYFAGLDRPNQKDMWPLHVRGWVCQRFSRYAGRNCLFDATLGGIGGQPASFIDGIGIRNKKYYYSDPSRPA